MHQELKKKQKRKFRFGLKKAKFTKNSFFLKKPRKIRSVSLYFDSLSNRLRHNRQGNSRVTVHLDVFPFWIFLTPAHRLLESASAQAAPLRRVGSYLNSIPVRIICLSSPLPAASPARNLSFLE